MSMLAAVTTPSPAAVPARPTGIARHVPGLQLLRTYERSWLRSDLVAGIVLAAILVPQGMAYAELAGLPAVNGLYTTVACLIGYAIMGPSRILVLGPDSSLGPLIFAAITPLVVAGDDPGKAIALAGMMAMIVGLRRDRARSRPAGFRRRPAVEGGAGRLHERAGADHHRRPTAQALRVLHRRRRLRRRDPQFVDGFSRRNATAMWLGISLLVVLLVLPRFTTKIPAVLLVVVGATVVTSVFDLDVKTVGALPQGFPRPTLPFTSVHDVIPMLVASIGITLVSLTDTIATSSAFAARRGDEVHPDQEMIGIGAANLMSGLFQGFAISTSGSRTAVAEQSGAKSQVTGLVGAGVVALMLIAFSSLFAELPQTALAAVVIAAAISLADIPAVVGFARVRKSSLLLSLAAFGGVVFFGVLPGIVVAIVLSILLFFRLNWWPHGEILGREEEHW